jgi:phosphatidate cytidylyltransferase
MCGTGSVAEILVLAAGIMGPLVIVAVPFDAPDASVAHGAALGMLIALAATMVPVSRHLGASSPGWVAVGVIAIGLACVAVALVRVRFGPDAVMWLLGTVWTTDVCAYAVGRAIGGPKLAPGISPNKTWAGLAGGIVGAALWSVAFASWREDAPAIAGAVAMAAAIAVIAQAGDLSVSFVKRRFGRKDTGNLIPGHGGVLDRIDGLLTTAPALALLLLLASEDMPHPW